MSASILGDGGRMGVVRIRRHLGWGWNHGFAQWAPYWAQSAIVTAWNWISCHTTGHDTIGPWEEPRDEDGRTIHVEGFRPGYFPKTCTACSKRWPEEICDGR